MTLDALIMFAGFLVAVLPFLGFPIQWDNYILVALGAFVIALGIFVRRRGSQRTAAPKEKEPLVQSAPQYGEGAQH